MASALTLVSESYDCMIWYPSEEGQLLYAAGVLSRETIPEYYRDSPWVPDNWQQDQWQLMIEADYQRRLVFAAIMLVRQLQLELSKQQ